MIGGLSDEINGELSAKPSGQVRPHKGERRTDTLHSRHQNRRHIVLKLPAILDHSCTQQDKVRSPGLQSADQLLHANVCSMVKDFPSPRPQEEVDTIQINLPWLILITGRDGNASLLSINGNIVLNAGKNSARCLFGKPEFVESDLANRLPGIKLGQHRIKDV